MRFAAAVWLCLLASTASLPARAAGRTLAPMDVVSIRILDDPSLNTSTRIEPDGTIVFPYVGRIRAAGLSEDQLAEAVERRLIAMKILPAP
jgi:protein involved in polysaccharide export with SLBB domain